MAKKQKRIRRESIPMDDNLLIGWKWGKWIQVMRRTKPFQSYGKRWIRRNSIGYRKKFTELEFKIPSNTCEIYEWAAMIEYTCLGIKGHVVHIGSTHKRKKGKLLRIIQEYCKRGSHKSWLIDHTLIRDFSLWVRVGTRTSKEAAETDENALLDRFDYAWNTRRNDKRKPRVI